ncbi:RNA recognition motif containing protein [Coccidioides posadasii C735 delta SOWgp]|uniref:RNA recognition motif containing protein n=1 Tax=Coccidioides posadasii (strain C735) TaxID=222929 RepID=C5P118_COCP7|nr:RNA recognition motif containing protein [Coccidioides posadasii C735 delta SOWgp]EER29376.1 RNA recognition motif containing protein [Coccidioides posadasii C735 delta SOWgp]|eukprot:XP_003071521.1 RNA recognition motif containing protein [Coccidioides posadasii C735 delta SOWgp]
MGPHRYPPSGPMQHFPQSNRSSISANSNYSAGSNVEPTAPTSRHLFVQNLSPGTTSQQLKDYLQATGTVSRCDVLDQRSFGRTKVCATVSFQDEEVAKAAISMFDNSTFMGSRIRVRFNRERSPSSGSQPKQPSSDEKSASHEHKTAEAGLDSDKPHAATATSLGGLKGEQACPEKKCGGPLVVNGSCVGMKAGRGKEEKRDYEGETCRISLILFFFFCQRG